jgi:hypothetical protein
MKQKFNVGDKVVIQMPSGKIEHGTVISTEKKSWSKYDYRVEVLFDMSQVTWCKILDVCPIPFWVESKQLKLLKPNFKVNNLVDVNFGNRKLPGQIKAIFGNEYEISVFDGSVPTGTSMETVDVTQLTLRPKAV